MSNYIYIYIYIYICSFVCRGGRWHYFDHLLLTTPWRTESENTLSNNRHTHTSSIGEGGEEIFTSFATPMYGAPLRWKTDPSSAPVQNLDDKLRKHALHIVDAIAVDCASNEPLFMQDYAREQRRWGIATWCGNHTS